MWPRRPSRRTKSDSGSNGANGPTPWATPCRSGLATACRVPGASRGIGAIRPGLLADIEPLLAHLHARLRSRVTFLAGVAFPHVAETDTGPSAGSGLPAPTKPPAGAP